MPCLVKSSTSSYIRICNDESLRGLKKLSSSLLEDRVVLDSRTGHFSQNCSDAASIRVSVHINTQVRCSNTFALLYLFLFNTVSRENMGSFTIVPLMRIMETGPVLETKRQMS